MADIDLEEGSSLRVATYIRISTDEENQPFSLEAQELRLAAYVKSQEGWHAVRAYSDRMTGSKLERPGLQKALADARAASICSSFTGSTGSRARSAGWRRSWRSWTAPRSASARPPSPSTLARRPVG